MDTYSNKTTQSDAHAALVEAIGTNNPLDAWSDIFEEAGGTVRQEVYAPCFSTALAEAYLDIQVHGLPELEGLFFDITIRHPRDARYAPALCAAHDGVALQRASAEKQTRYPPPPMPAGKGRHPGGLKLGATLSRRRTYPGFVRCKRSPTRSHKRTPRIFRPPPQMERLP